MARTPPIAIGLILFCFRFNCCVAFAYKFCDPVYMHLTHNGKVRKRLQDTCLALSILRERGDFLCDTE